MTKVKFLILISLNTLVHKNANHVQLQVQLQKIGDAIRVKITKIFTKNQLYKIKCIQVHKVLYDTEHSLGSSGQGFSAKI